jgi:hypothetical protein
MRSHKDSRYSQAGSGKGSGKNLLGMLRADGPRRNEQTQRKCSLFARSEPRSGRRRHKDARPSTTLPLAQSAKKTFSFFKRANSFRFTLSLERKGFRVIHVTFEDFGETSLGGNAALRKKKWQSSLSFLRYKKEKRRKEKRKEKRSFASPLFFFVRLSLFSLLWLGAKSPRSGWRGSGVGLFPLRPRVSVSSPSWQKGACFVLVF